MKSRKRFVVGNWKMNGGLNANSALLSALRAGVDPELLLRVDIAVLPPYPYLAQAAQALVGSGIAWGAQDVAEHQDGAYTGEVSARMLADLGCRWTVLGHSERRAIQGETDALVRRKAARALADGIGVILCVGETLAEREAERTEAVIAGQLQGIASLAGVASPRSLVIAYEPVWAIGTGRSASPEQAQQVHAFIRAQLAAASLDAPATRILYGGSLKAASAPGLFAMPDIDGGLIGGASLVAEEFIAIARSAAAD